MSSFKPFKESLARLTVVLAVGHYCLFSRGHNSSQVDLLS